MIRVGVFGAGGRMGATVCEAVRDVAGSRARRRGRPVPRGPAPARSRAPISRSPRTPRRSPTRGAEVAVDFTVVDAARENLRWCAEHGVHAVVGHDRLQSDDDLDEFAELFAAHAAPTR